MMSELVIKENIALAPLTSFKVGGLAKYFVQVTTLDELLDALEVAKKNAWPAFVLAGGSNLIVSDSGFDGLVIALAMTGWQIEGDKLTSAPSTSMTELVNASIDKGLAGLEWAGGLPGSFGGAIRGNAGCFGGEIKDSVLSVRSVEISSGREIVRDRAKCEFDYRDSVYKHRAEIIVEATLELNLGNAKELREIADSHIAFRQERHPLELPNAGSIFKNIPLEQVPKEHLPLFADAIKNDPFPVVPTAKVIAVANLKGLRVGNAQLSQKHSNMIVNLDGATSDDVMRLIDKIRLKIHELYGVKLEIEPELVGF